jgi:hypothetical protein
VKPATTSAAYSVVPDAEGQRVQGAAHGGVAVRGLDEVAGLDDLLSRDRVADAGRDAVAGRVVLDPGLLLEGALHHPQCLDLGREGRHLGHPVGIDEVVLEDGELRGIGQRVVRPVLLLQEVVHLRGRELVGVAAVHAHAEGIAGLDVDRAPRSHHVRGQDLLRHVHGARRRVGLGQPDLSRGVGLGEREKPAVLDDHPRDDVVILRQLGERDLFPGLQPAQQRMVAHEDALGDVVARVDGRERRRDGDADPRPLLGLDRGLARGAHALALPGDDDLEPAVHQRPLGEEPLALHRDPGVGVLRDVLGLVIEARPGGSHGVRVDVVHEVLDPQVLHPQVELALELLADQVRVLGQKEDPLSGREGNRLAGSHRFAHETFM